MLQYRIRLTKDTNHTFLVTAPSVPPALTCGKTREEARAYAAEAIEAAFIGYMRSGQDIPPSDTGRGEMVTLPPITEAKLGLYMAMRAARVTKADLARRLDQHRQQVDRLLDINHASRIEQIDAALHTLGKKLSVQIHEAA
jgi:antitoxin HicB